MTPRSAFSFNAAVHRCATAFPFLFFLAALSGAQSPQAPLELQRGQNSTEFGQSSRGKTGPVDWVKDEKTGKIQVMLEKDGRYTPGTFLGRGPDGSDYFTFAAKHYRLSVPLKPPKPSGNGLGRMGSLGRLAGPLGGAAGSAVAQSGRSGPKSNVEFTEIPSREIPPANFLSLGKPQGNATPASAGIPVLTEFKDAKGAITTRTLELPGQGSAFVVTPAPCFGADAYANPAAPTMVYVLSRDAQTHAVTGYKQITNNSGKDPCDNAPAATPAASAAPSGSAAKAPKPDYTLTPLDGDQYRLIYTDNNGRQDIIVTKLKEHLFCSTTLGKTYIIAPDAELSVLASDQAMQIKCTMKSAEQYQQAQH